jgi:hypothetical protein
MWILGKLKKRELLVDSRIIYSRYNKILITVNSCTTMDHINTCKRIISNYDKWCRDVNVDYKTYKMLIKFLNNSLKAQIIRLT